MSSTIAIAFRKASAHDIHALGQVFEQAYADKNEATDLPQYLACSIRASDIRVIVAETAEHKIAGFVMTEFNSHTMRNAVHVAHIAVSPEFQGMGVGRQLLEQTEQAALKNEFDTVTLQVRKSNAKAIGLYESMGFGAIGEDRSYYRDGENALEMKKYLNPAQPPKGLHLPRFFRRLAGIYA